MCCERQAHFNKSQRLFTVFLLLSCVSCGEPVVTVVSYDAARTWDGLTCFVGWDVTRILAVDMEGQTVFDFPTGDSVRAGVANGFRALDDGSVIYLCNGKPMQIRVADHEILFEGSDQKAHHSILKTPHGNLMYLAADLFPVEYDFWAPFTCAQGDAIQEMDVQSGDVVWEWRLRDHLDPALHHAEGDPIGTVEGCVDWSHGNTVKFRGGYFYEGMQRDIVVYNSLALNTFWIIDYPSGEVLWSCGQHGDFGWPGVEQAPFAGAHEVEMVEQNIFVLYDNGNHRPLHTSRALKLAVDPSVGQVHELWFWSYPLMYDWWGGDADVLPNGNVLVTNTTQGALFEVTSEGDIVWEMRFYYPPTFPISIYQSQRVPFSWFPGPS